MLILLVSTVLLSTGTLASSPSTEWQLIRNDRETVDFPLSNTVMQIKSYRHQNHDNDPYHGNNTNVDKSTSMLLYAYSKGQRTGVLVWNTIAYVAGTDVIMFGCQAPYSRYRSKPCEGKFEQIWSWNFTKEGATLKCDDEIQYEVDFTSTNNPMCKMWLLEIDELRFTNMAGFYYRAAPVEDPFDTPKPTTPAPTPSEDLKNFRPTCDCWSKECGHCTNLQCAVKYNLTSAEEGITVESMLNRKDWNHIVLYNGEGKRIGFFKWNLKAMFLEGCLFCRTPRGMPNVAKGNDNQWNFSFVNGTIILKFGDDVDNMQVGVEKRLRKGCADHYKDVQYFAFQRMSCEHKFHVLENQMTLGTLMDPTCNGQCPS